MRRLLLVAVAAGLPALAAAQTAGQLTGVTNNLIGTQQCLGEASLEVRWAMAPLPNNGGVSGTGTVRIFASNKARTATTDDPRTCVLATDTTNDATIKTHEVTQFDDVAIASNQQTIEAGDLAAMATALGLDCNTETTATPIYMCALAYVNDQTASHLGYANGQFTLNTRKPPPVTDVRVESAENALRVRWTEATTGENATEFRVEAVTADTRDGTPGVPHRVRTNGSPVMVEGLVNLVEYDVTVVAISAAGTESDPAPAPAAKGTPRPTDDFWDWYERHGGVEQGGCASGAAGVLALVGAAALVRVRRRKP